MAEQRRQATPAEEFTDLVAELVYNRRHVERIPYWTSSRHKKLREHVVTLPPLLEAMAEAAMPGGRTSDEQDTGSSPPGPRPPVDIDAVDRLDAIERAVAGWLRQLDLPGRGDVSADLRHLVGVTGTLASGDLAALLIDARRWQVWAEVVTHERAAGFVPEAPCPCCERRSSIRVRGDVRRAYCSRCEATWDEDSIGILARHIAEWTRANEGLFARLPFLRRPRCRCECHGTETNLCSLPGGCGPMHFREQPNTEDTA